MPDKVAGFLGRLLGWFRGSAESETPRYLLVPLAVTVLVAVVFFLNLGFFKVLDLKILDEHFRLRGRRVPSVPVRVVAIDDASIEKLGRWPWPRRTPAWRCSAT